MTPHHLILINFIIKQLYFNRRYTVKKGDLVLIPINEIHKTSDAGAPVYEKILVIFKKCIFKTILFRMVDEDNNPVCSSAILTKILWIILL